MKHPVPSSLPFTEMVATRMKMKPANTAQGGVGSEIRMFDWEQDIFTTESGVKGLIALTHVPVCYVAVVEISGSIKHVRKLIATRSKVN